MTVAVRLRKPANLANRLERRARALGARLRRYTGWPSPGPGPAGLSTAFAHTIDIRERQALVSLYRSHFPASAESEVAQAQRLLRHEFDLLGHPATHDRTIAWSRDPVSGRDWDRGYSAEIKYRGDGRLGDVKLPWELSKHQYFFTLGKAAWLTGEPAYAVEIVRQIEHWISDNPYERGIHWISALEAGTRALSWILAYPFYAEHCDAAFERRLAASLATHVLFVERHLSQGRYTNTHLVGEATTLVAGGLFLDCRHSRRWLRKGLALLEQESAGQVAADGVHAERSVAYHRFFLDHYYLASAMLAINGRSLSGESRQTMERMTGFLMDMAVGENDAVAFGDDDNARGVWLHAKCCTEFRSLVALGAVLFGRGDFKLASGRLPEEVLWLFGRRGVEQLATLEPQFPIHESTMYATGGYAIMRGGWNERDPVLAFDCGPLGHGTAGHGHADALSLQLSAGGYSFLADPGTYSYNLDYRWRDVFRSTRAHNTIAVDRVDQSIPADRMSWHSQASARCIRWLTTRWFDLVDGEHDGYCRLEDPVMHRRAVVYLKPDAWLVWDRVDGGAKHELEWLLHTRPDCQVKAGMRNGGAILTSPEGSSLRISMLDSGSASGGLQLAGPDDGDALGWHSPRYGIRVPSRTLRLSREFNGSCAIAATLETSERRSFELAALHDGSIEVTARDEAGATEMFFYRTSKHALSRSDGVRFDGEILYRRNAGDAHSALWAGSFRELRVPDLVDVRSSAPVESLDLVNGRCSIAASSSGAGDIEVGVRDGVEVVVNGSRIRAATLGPRNPSTVGQQ